MYTVVKAGYRSLVIYLQYRLQESNKINKRRYIKQSTQLMSILKVYKWKE